MPFDAVLDRVFGPEDPAFFMIFDQMNLTTVSHYSWGAYVRQAAQGAVNVLQLCWLLVGAVRPKLPLVAQNWTPEEVERYVAFMEGGYVAF